MNLRRLLILTTGILLFSFTSGNCQQLYVGANYHPHDSNPQQWEKDIKLMKEAGFTVARLGHLAWDSYEPEDGKFEFEWFDTVMDQMADAGIKVILDIAIRPAPLWLHKKYPSINITDPNGSMLYPNRRYMEDVGDPMYKKYALRFADEMTKRYGKHPALLAFGIDNEPGDGRISYSEEVRGRFIAWLKTKYVTTDKLNKAWAGQRWSRKISDFDEIGLPLSGTAVGAPEKVLDFRRFLSEEINDILFKVIDVVNKNAPNAQTNTNPWYYCGRGKYYDYAPMAYSGKMTREGNGFYPGSSLLSNSSIKNSLFGIARIQYERTTPFWCSEFTTMVAVPKAVRKYAYLTLMYGNQMICGWTWQTMHGGEEQYMQGMMDWDGKTNGKYDEYKQIAAEFKKIEKYFPYQVNADVALAYSFPSQIAEGYFPVKHDEQVQQCFSLFFDRNMDVRIIDPVRSALNYKLLIIPGMSLMDKESASNIRNYVKNGGTVIMTGNSAVVEENGQVFASTRPGYLNDVFGIRVGGFGHTGVMNEISRTANQGNSLVVSYKGKEMRVNSERYEYINTEGADAVGHITSLDKDYPIITSNSYGKGKAIYIGMPVANEVMNTLIDELTADLSLKKGPDVPAGVAARQIDETHILLFNMTAEPKEVTVKGNAKSILTNKKHKGTFVIEPHEPEFIELEK